MDEYELTTIGWLGDATPAAAPVAAGATTAPTTPSGVGERFGQRAREYGARLRPLLERARDNGADIAIYGAGCRACTFTNTHKMSGLIQFSVDDQKERQGMFLPGTRIPIASPQELNGSAAPLICLLAVNQENEAIVSDRLRANLNRPLHIASIFAPSDIWRELDRLDTVSGGWNG